MSDSIKLKKSLFGFKKHSVLDYISTVSKNVDDKLFLKDNEIKKHKKAIEELNATIEKLNKEIADFEEEKKKISELYIHAEEMSAKIIKEAEEKAQNLISDANSDIESKKEKFMAEQAEKRIEFDKELDSKKAIISSYKSEVRNLQEKIKITLANFDEILSDTIK